MADSPVTLSSGSISYAVVAPSGWPTNLDAGASITPGLLCVGGNGGLASVTSYALKKGPPSEQVFPTRDLYPADKPTDAAPLSPPSVPTPGNAVASAERPADNKGSRLGSMWLLIKWYLSMKYNLNLFDNSPPATLRAADLSATAAPDVKSTASLPPVQPTPAQRLLDGLETKIKANRTVALAELERGIDQLDQKEVKEFVELVTRDDTSDLLRDAVLEKLFAMEDKLRDKYNLRNADFKIFSAEDAHIDAAYRAANIARWNDKIRNAPNWPYKKK